MFETVFRSEDVPAAERPERWREHIRRLHPAAEVAGKDTGGFRAYHRVRDLGTVRVWQEEVQSIHLRRAGRRAQQAGGDLYVLGMSLSGTVEITQGDRRVLVRPYELCLSDATLPGGIRSINHHEAFRGIGLLVPKRQLALPEEHIAPLLARPLPARQGVGGLLAGLFTQLATDATGYRAADGPRLGAALVELLSALLGHELHARSTEPAPGRRRALTTRIQGFIQRHLHDTELNPAKIAAAHHISTSYLHRLFQAEGITVTGWIRHERLEHARRDLADPALREVAVHHIAARRGFAHPAAFSRAFRAAYGLPPSDYRRRVLHQAV
ncbi:helix-turn-helix domain-containing protein [Streptomyces synnematoformans]|uniref:Helix-turn-helix domain-containing protein n=1 Tax=Streptomyces synnematoformans TaxID=415721 RepID=A0ABN1ZXE1_9ACTN